MSLMEDEQWNCFSPQHFIPIHSIVEVVVSLMDDRPFTDSSQERVGSGSKFGLAVEVTPKGFYVKKGHKLNDGTMPLLLEEVSDKMGKVYGQ